MDWNHARNVEFVPDKVVPVERLIILAPEMKDDSLATAKPLGQGQAEKARGVRCGSAAAQTVRRSDLDIGERQLAVGITVQLQDGASQDHGFALVQEDNRQYGSQNSETYDCPYRRLRSAAHSAHYSEYARTHFVYSRFRVVGYFKVAHYQVSRQSVEVRAPPAMLTRARASFARAEIFEETSKM